MMSSPNNYTADQGNGLTDQQQQQYNSNSSGALNGNSGSMSTGDHSSAVIIGAMKSYADESSSDSKSNICQVSTLPTSSTTSTISTSSSTNATFTSSGGGGGLGNGVGDDVCRDYLRNVCRRGKSCRFKHPDTDGADMMGGGGGGGSSGGGPANNRKSSDSNYVFCHDFQNRECRRENCRFLHCSKAEEEIFRGTGKLPQHVSGSAAAAALGDGKDPSTPICKDFVNGICRRAPGRCKFRHPASSDSSYHQNSPTNARNSYDGRNGNRGNGSNFAMCSTNNSPHGMAEAYGYGRAAHGAASNLTISSSYGYGNDQYGDNNPNKRKRFDSMYSTPNNGPYSGGAYTDSMGQVHGYGAMHSASSYYGAPSPAARATMDSRSYLEEENAALRRRIDDLKKQVSELVTTNEYLMDQINQLRVQNVAANAPAAAVAVATATSVASLQPPQSSTAVGISGSLSAGPLTTLSLQAPLSVPPPPPPPGTAVVATPVAMTALAPSVVTPSSIVSSIGTISLPTVSAPVSLVNSSAASLVSYTPTLVHSSAPWPLGVDQ